MPEVLNKDRVNEFRGELEQQYHAANPTERILIDEMARHAAMLELGEQAEASVLRHGARELSKIILAGVDESAEEHKEREDTILSAAVSTDALDKFGRYRRRHEKAFFAALNKLGELQADRKNAHKTNAVEIARTTDPFSTERACEEHLSDRFRHPNWRCPRCGHARGSWLKQRQRWECGNCHRQIGIRYGTVMQGSRLPLRTWFQAIIVVVSDPGVATTTLADALGLKRRETVRRLMCKIRKAIALANANELLADLVQYPAGVAVREP